MAEPWLSPGDVAAAGGVEQSSGNNALAAATRAAMAYVERVRPDLATGQDPAYAPTPDVKHGAAMLAARLYERRSAVLGVVPSAGYGGGGYDDGAASILRYDPDIERLLGIGRSRPFGFGAAS